jgi:hypothetical protein
VGQEIPDPACDEACRTGGLATLLVGERARRAGFTDRDPRALAEQDLPIALCEHSPPAPITATSAPADIPALAELERRYVRQILELTKNDKTDAARILASIAARGIAARAGDTTHEATAGPSASAHPAP